MLPVCMRFGTLSTQHAPCFACMHIYTCGQGEYCITFLVMSLTKPTHSNFFNLRISSSMYACDMPSLVHSELPCHTREQDGLHAELGGREMLVTHPRSTTNTCTVQPVMLGCNQWVAMCMCATSKGMHPLHACVAFGHLNKGVMLPEHQLLCRETFMTSLLSSAGVHSTVCSRAVKAATMCRTVWYSSSSLKSSCSCSGNRRNPFSSLRLPCMHTYWMRSCTNLLVPSRPCKQPGHLPRMAPKFSGAAAADRSMDATSRSMPQM